MDSDSNAERVWPGLVGNIIDNIARYGAILYIIYGNYSISSTDGYTWFFMIQYSIKHTGASYRVGQGNPGRQAWLLDNKLVTVDKGGVYTIDKLLQHHLHITKGV